MCRYCNAVASKAMSVEHWDEHHKDHGPKTEEPFEHPSGTWYWVVCPCGAKHLRIRQES